jgi:hypothetical protein
MQIYDAVIEAAARLTSKELVLACCPETDVGSEDTLHFNLAVDRARYLGGYFD